MIDFAVDKIPGIIETYSLIDLSLFNTFTTGAEFLEKPGIPDFNKFTACIRGQSSYNF